MAYQNFIWVATLRWLGFLKRVVLKWPLTGCTDLGLHVTNINCVLRMRVKWVSLLMTETETWQALNSDFGMLHGVDNRSRNCNTSISPNMWAQFLVWDFMILRCQGLSQVHLLNAPPSIDMPCMWGIIIITITADCWMMGSDFLDWRWHCVYWGNKSCGPYNCRLNCVAENFFLTPGYVHTL